MVKSWFNVQRQVVTGLVTSLGIMLPIVVFQAVQEPTNQRAGPKMAQIRNPSGEHFLYVTKLSLQCTEVRFASLLSGGFITAIVLNLPERKLTRRTSV